MNNKLLSAALCAVLLASISQAGASTLDVSLGSLPFGPFSPTATVLITGTLTNTSADQTISVCEGCVGGSGYDFSLGGFASTPTATANYYSFVFGNGGDTSAGFLNDQVNGTIAPGQTKSFIFGEYVPNNDVAVPVGSYGFSVALQVFADTLDRPYVGGSSFGGNWEVSATPLPPAWTMMLIGLAGLGFMAYRRNSKPVLMEA
jgi:hypothetical protein